jgi:hypothetical protein
MRERAGITADGLGCYYRIPVEVWVVIAAGCEGSRLLHTRCL